MGNKNCLPSKGSSANQKITQKQSHSSNTTSTSKNNNSDMLSNIENQKNT